MTEEEKNSPEADSQQESPPEAPPVDPPQDAPGSGQEPENGRGEQVFTQDDLNRLVPERGKQYFRSMLKDIGVEDAGEIKASLAKLKEAEQAQMSEIEKAQKAVKEAGVLARKAQEERDLAQEQARDTLIQAAIMAQAAVQGAAHPEDAYHLADLGIITLDDGKVLGADKAVAALVEAGRIPLHGKPRAPDLDGGAGSGKRSGEREVALTPEELETAKKMRITPEDYQKYKRKKE